jgi:hypothetical protein
MAPLFQQQSCPFLASHHRLPTTYASRAYPDVGGQMSYGTDVTDSYRQSGVYTLRKRPKPYRLCSSGSPIPSASVRQSYRICEFRTEMGKKWLQELKAVTQRKPGCVDRMPVRPASFEQSRHRPRHWGWTRRSLVARRRRAPRFPAMPHELAFPLRLQPYRSRT